MARWRRLVRSYRASWVAVAALWVLVLLMLASIFAPLISPQDPFDLMQLSLWDSNLPPGSLNSVSGYVYIFGTDDQGRDMYSALLRGLGISLLIGFSSAMIAAVLGCCLGLFAGFRGGRVDNAIMRLVDFQLAFPAIMMALILTAVFGKGLMSVFIALIIVEWAYYARTARGSALVESSREYIEAARGLGLSQRRILLRHLMPNCIPPILVIGPMQIGRAILIESTLSFLGLGVPPTQPSLGLLIANGHQYLMAGQYWISIFPGITLMILIMCINIVGDRIRIIMNPRNRP